MNFLIRPAVSADCETIRPLQQEIADLHHRGRPDLFRRDARFFTQEAFDNRLSQPGHFVWVAEAEGHVVGYAFAWVIAHRGHSTYVDFDSFYIDDICVSEAYRRRGIGKALWKECKGKARELGCRNMDLGVWSFNQGAIAFYESCGMTERVRRMEYHLEREDSAYETHRNRHIGNGQTDSAPVH